MTKTKIGRNELCPCGSGKKYKNCCLGKTGPENKDLSSQNDEELSANRLDYADNSAAHERIRNSEELMKDPSLQRLVEQQLEKHWENWIHDRLPVFKNKTPAEMVKTRVGREQVKALLDDFELRDKDAPPHMKQLKYINQVRKRLGLAD